MPDDAIILRPFERLSNSKIDNAEACLRHYHFQHVLGLEEEMTPARQQRIDVGNAFDAQVEEYVKGIRKEITGAVAAVARYYPLPGQSCVDVQRWVRSTWAGAPWVGKLDLLTGPSTKWGPLAQEQKKGLVRVTDLKSTSSLKWALTREQLDTNRQLHMYASGVYRQREVEMPPLIEISQVVVERAAPHKCQGPVRVVSRQQSEDLEGSDVPLISAMIASHQEEDTLQLPAAPRSQCERWYGDRCPYYERCHGRGHARVAESLGALMDAGAGRGTSGVGRTIDEIAAVTAPDGARSPDERNTPQQKAQEVDMSELKTPDAAKFENAKIEGESARYRPRTIVDGKSYVAVQGDRYGKTWEFRMRGDQWIIRVADKPGPVEAVPGFFPVDTTDTSATGAVPAGTGPKMDIVQLRGVFGPFLERWDSEVSATAAKQGEAATEPEDDIFGGAAKRIAEQSSSSGAAVAGQLEGRVRELTGVGLTDAQARSLADGGITLEALRAGSITVADLTRCRGIGKGGAEKILARFQVSGKAAKDEAARDQEKVEKLTVPMSHLSQADIDANASIPQRMMDQVASSTGSPSDDLAMLRGDLSAATSRERGLVQRIEELEHALREAARELERRNTSEKSEGFTIFVGCRPTHGRGEIFDFLEVLSPYLDRVAAAKKVRDVSMVDPGYTVPGLVNEALHADPPAPCAFSVDPLDQTWQWVRRYFLSRATEVVVSSSSG